MSAASVTALWEAYMGVMATGNMLQNLDNGRYLGTTAPTDTIVLAAFNLIPAILAVPARSTDEAMMQVFALAAWVTAEAESDHSVSKENAREWRAALVSITRALAEDGPFTPPLLGCTLGDFVGEGAVRDIKARLAYLDQQGEDRP